MKKLLIGVVAIITLLTASNINVSAQSNNDSISESVNLPSATYKDYLKKSHNQKITSMVIAGAGAILTTIGFSMTLSDLSGLFDPSSPPNDYGSSADVLTIGGLVLIVAAVPISLASRANKKRARLYMNKESVMITPTLRKAQIASIGIKISL